MRTASALILIVLTTFAFAEDKPTHKDISPDEFEKLSKEANIVILDVRHPNEYAAGHMKGAVLINYKDASFVEKVKELDRGKTYLVYCAVGMRGTWACEKMAKLDFPKLYNLEGGLKAWEKAGKPVEK